MSESAPTFEIPEIRIGILTISDRASRGEYPDAGGPAIQDSLNEFLLSSWKPLVRLIPDDQRLIEQTLIEFCDREECCLVITTGGTGPALRDVTPEATEQVCEKLLPGFGERMRQVSLENVPTAILSRQTAGIRGRSLIVNLPGRPRAIRECLNVILPAIPGCLSLINGPSLKLKSSTH